MTARRLLGLLLASTLIAPASAEPHHSRHPSATGLTPGQRALAQAEAARHALEQKQAQEAQTLRARQAAAQAAQQQARQQSSRTATLTTQTRRAQSALDATNAHIVALTAEISALQTKRDALAADIKAQNTQLQPLLPIAERLSVTPNAALLASPGSAAKSVEALSILGGFAQLTRQKVDQIQSRRTELQATTDTMKAREAELSALRQSQTRARDLSAARTSRSAQQEALAIRSADNARQAVTQAMQDAADLSSAILAIEQQEARARAQLEAEAQALARAHRMAEARRATSRAQALTSNGTGVSSGSGHAPVAGHVVTRWGQQTEAGPATGVTYAASAGAAVLAPCAGRIEFAGPFRSFGEILILDCGRNYRFVLSGLGTLAVSSGSAVGRSAHLGVMSVSSPQLFVQLRHGTQTVNPAPFL